MIYSRTDPRCSSRLTQDIVFETTNPSLLQTYIFHSSPSIFRTSEQISVMAGYGNRTAPDYVAEELEDQHTSTRLGLHESSAPYSNAHHTHGSGTTGGAGFGTLSTRHSKPHYELPSFRPYKGSKILTNPPRKQTFLRHPNRQ